MLKAVVRVSGSIGMKLNIAKCATTNMVKGFPKADGIGSVYGETFPLVTEDNQ